MKKADLHIELLADHSDAVSQLASWFAAEWLDHYGADGETLAAEDIRECANRDELPLAYVAVLEGRVCGTASLKRQSIASHDHLSPWLAALFVHRPLRGRGIGRALCEAIVRQAVSMGYPALYAGTEIAAFFERLGWKEIDRVLYHGKPIAVFQYTQ